MFTICITYTVYSLESLRLLCCFEIGLSLKHTYNYISLVEKVIIWNAKSEIKLSD